MLSISFIITDIPGFISDSLFILCANLLVVLQHSLTNLEKPGILTMANIHFFFHGVSITLDNRSKLKHFIADLFRSEKRKLKSLQYVFCSDEYLLEINRQYLQHDFYTDIISFELGDSFVTEGEIYISVDRIRENAGILGKTIKEELHRVIFHGALHLCGYKDKLKKDQLEMRKKEDRYLQKYFKL